MFKKLFKPKWQSAKPQVRIQAVSQLNAADSDDFHIIELLAKNDVEADVRLAAVTKITQQDKLLSIVQQERNPEARIKMIEHLMQQLSNDAELDERIESLIKGLDGQALTTIIENTKSAALGLLALESITDQDVLKGYAISLPLAALRVKAAEKINDEALLEDIEKLSKGKDKTVFRIARNKLTEIREELKKEENLEQQIDTICRNMEQLARTNDDPMYQTKVDHWHKQWTRIEMHAGMDDAQRFNRAYELCRQVVVEAQQEEDALKEHAQQQRESLQERMAACEQLEGTLQQLKDANEIKAEDVPALSALLKTQQTRWEEAAQISSPQADERKRFNRTYSVLEKALTSVQLLNERREALEKSARAIMDVDDASAHQLVGLKKSLDQAMKGLEWPEDLALPAVLDLVNKARIAHEAMRKKAQQKESEAIGKLKDLLKELDGAINDGNLKPANKFLGDAQKWVKHIPIKSANKFQKELRDYTARVNELRDWQGFAITPKKEQLVTDMEALVDADMDPQELANRIKRLQSEWKSLGHSKDSQALWERFSQASEKAYEPCKAYFENLSGVRQQNLESRKAIVAQLGDYLTNFNFSNADWGAVNQVYETAKQEWRRYTPVERKEGKLVQDQFNQLLDALRGKLNDEFERNKAKREALIEKAESLLEEPDLNKAIEEAKGLQRQWKDTGLVARKDENKLWKRFRGACDGIFERRDSERKAANEERTKNLEEANHIIELIEHLSDSESHSIADSQKEFRDLQQRFSDVGSMPKEHYEDAHKRYKAVCDQYAEGIQVAKASARRAGVARVWQVMAELDAFEDKCISESQMDLLGDELGQDVQEDAAVKVGLPVRYEQLKQIASGGEKPSSDQLQNNTEQLRALCIQLEIAAGVDSPSEDQSTRMELQVSRLSNGFGQGEQGKAVSEQVLKLQRQWCEVGPAVSAERAKYTQRFVSVLKKIGEL